MSKTSAEERTAICDAVRDLMQDKSSEAAVRSTMETPRGYDPELWSRLAEIGIVGLLIDPEYGGTGLGPVELELVIEETGAALLCSPLLSSGVMGASLLAAAEDKEAQARLLPGIVAGTTIATVAITGDAGSWTPEGVTVDAQPANGHAVLSGVASYVTHGQIADLVLVVAKTGTGFGIFEVAADAAGLTRSALSSVDKTLRLARLEFANTPARQIGRMGWPAVQSALDLALVALAGEQAGGARRVFDMTIDYAKTRIQFGRPIGGFQAIKHMAADLMIEVGSATSAARDAAEQLAEKTNAAGEAVSLAAFACAEAYSKVAAASIQMHGGIAFTWEYPAHLYLRRARAYAQLLGSPALYREIYLTQLGARPMVYLEADIMADIEDSNPVDAALRAEVRAWLKANWTGELPVEQDKWNLSTATRAWTAKVLEAGWAVPTWPREWFGRGLTQEQGDIVDHEFARLGAPGARQDRSNLAANTMLAFGEEALKRDMIPGLLKREIVQCLLYSEPAAGSDLAGVRTRAERDGDDYIINGQKVWTSGAVHAHYGMLLARTDWDVPKHKGLTFFFFPMKQPGVEVRPLRQITDEQHFNEVFITNARVPAANIMGGLNNGWRVLQTALAYERSTMGDRPRGARHSTTSNDLVALARQYGNLNDPALRQDLAGVVALRKLNALNNARAKANIEQGTSSSLMSLGKLAMSRILHEAARVRTAIIGAESLLDGPDHPFADDANFLAFNAYFTSIGGGTDQIQRNIISERVLGLPKEIEVDRNLPFRQVRSG